MQELLWEPEFHKKIANELPKVRPKVVVQIKGELRTPYTQKDTVILPVDYLAYLGI